MAKGYIQANVVILPERYAYDFLKFCYRHPKSCPLLDVTEVGEFPFPKYGTGADIPVRHIEEGHNVPMYITKHSY